MRLDLKRIGGLPRKLLNHARLLRDDPEAFARNVIQFTHPTLFEQRLLDMRNATPMHVRRTAGLAPALNILDAGWTRRGMTGGPNTVINLACRIARTGVPVRLVATVSEPAIDPEWFVGHARSLLASDDFPGLPVVSAARPDRPLPVSPHDVFLATHWTTAQQLKAVLPDMATKQFFYMLQEFEPGFHAWSSNFALALETYGLDFWPIINESLLAEYLLSQPYGRLADPVTRARAMIFEPATDSRIFHHEPHDTSLRPRRLLFYARPTNTRNLFGLALAALRDAVADPLFAGWEFLSIGARGAIPDLPLGHGHTLRQAPWMDYAGYGDLLRGADVLLCPMLSPHTSYPVLEMAACGGISVTNTFATKTASALRALSDNIIPVEPTKRGFAEGVCAAAQAAAASGNRAASLNMPRSWDETLDPVALRVTAIFTTLVVGDQSEQGPDVPPPGLAGA